MPVFKTTVEVDSYDIAYQLTHDGNTHDATTIMSALIGQADKVFDVLFDFCGEADSYKDEARDIVAALSDNQKPVARAFLTALLAELEDA